jgi:hypothetical protein
MAATLGWGVAPFCPPPSSQLLARHRRVADHRRGAGRGDREGRQDGDEERSADDRAERFGEATEDSPCQPRSTRSRERLVNAASGFPLC